MVTSEKANSVLPIQEQLLTNPWAKLHLPIVMTWTHGTAYMI